MLKTLIGYTAEIDDDRQAVEQIKSQLGLETNLLKNSIGIIACHYEFIFSGIVKAVCDALPFDVVGTISTSQAVEGQADALLLTIMVMTSDDVEFTSVITPSLQGEPGKAIAQSYREAASARQEKPALILAFAPFMPQNSGDEYVNTITEASNGVPCFGTLAIDDTEDFSSTFMIANGEHYTDKMVMVLCYGSITPKFFIANISPDWVLDQSAIITKSAGHVIMEVNGKTVDQFFEDLGIAKVAETLYAMTSLPFLIDYNDGTPKVSKVFVSFTPERYALCAGATPEGSTLYMAKSDKEGVLQTTEQTVDQMLQEVQGASGALIYSCITRSMALGSDQYGEMALVDNKTQGKLPFMMVCSGGEICPTQIASNKAINRFHNNTFVACVF